MVTKAERDGVRTGEAQRIFRIVKLFFMVLYWWMKVKVLVAQSCLTLEMPWTVPTGLLSLCDSPGNAYHYIFGKTNRKYNTKNGLLCKLWTLGDHNVLM